MFVIQERIIFQTLLSFRPCHIVEVHDFVKSTLNRLIRTLISERTFNAKE